VVFGHPWQQRVAVTLRGAAPWRLAVDVGREQAAVGADRFALEATQAGDDVALALQLDRCRRTVPQADYGRFRRWAAGLDTALQRAVRVVRGAP
jgi:hypothetical protein